MSLVSVSPPRAVAAATAARVVEATAILWCRYLTFPTAREVGSLAGVGASTVVSAFGSMAALLDAVVDGELEALRGCVSAIDADAAVAAHVEHLRTRDAALARLPWMATARAASLCIERTSTPGNTTNVRKRNPVNSLDG